jgi:hypothetical protein
VAIRQEQRRGGSRILRPQGLVECRQPAASHLLDVRPNNSSYFHIHVSIPA